MNTHEIYTNEPVPFISGMDEMTATSSEKQRMSETSQHSNQQVFNDRTPLNTKPMAASNDSIDPSSRSLDDTELDQYRIDSITYEEQIASCQKTIAQLRQTIQSMEEQLLLREQRQKEIDSINHRFVHQLFHLCAIHSPKSKVSKPSHRHMKTFIRQTFDHLIRQQVKVDCEKERFEDEKHRPSYEFCLEILEQYQNLFGIENVSDIPSSLMTLYYKHGELKNFFRATSSLLQIDTKNPELLIAPLTKIVEQSKTDEMIAFRKLNVNEALQKIQAHDHLLPSYYHFIEQVANLLEVSKGDQIIPAIKTLKLLAHSEMYPR